MDLKGFTLKNIILGITLAFAFVSWGSLLSLQAPFYPHEAEERGCKPAQVHKVISKRKSYEVKLVSNWLNFKLLQYGPTFGIADLTAFLTSPLVGKSGGKISPKLMLTLGSLTLGLAGVGFGFLDFVRDALLFLVLSYILRIFNGLSQAACWCSIIAILMSLFPNNVASIMGWTEVFTGVGFTMGPAIGAGLYSFGGFSLPFWVVGGSCLILALMTILAIPPVNQPCQEQAPDDKISIIKVCSLIEVKHCNNNKFNALIFIRTDQFGFHWWAIWLAPSTTLPLRPFLSLSCWSLSKLTILKSVTLLWLPGLLIWLLAP